MFEIGASLREARLRKGLDFPEVESGTKIRGKYLQALEDEEFDQLPGETYIKGFLRTYADYLGLDGQLYVDEFNSRYVAPEEQLPIRVRRSAQAHSRRRVQGGVLLAALLGIALITALVIVAWTSGSPSKQKLAGVPAAGTKQKHRPVHRHVAVGKRPWITLKAVRGTVLLLAVRKGGPHGKVLAQSKELSRGHLMRFYRRKLWVNTGTPQNLRVVVNGKRMTYPGGKPQAFVVTARGIFASA